MNLHYYFLFGLFTIVSCAHHHKEYSQDDHKAHHKEQQADQHNDEVQGISLNEGMKWETDADLKKNMNNINHELQKVKKLEKLSQTNSKTYDIFYHSIQATTLQIINTCKMPDGMHENYHLILENILNNSEDLKDSGKQKEVTGKLTVTLKKYTEYFNHDLNVE